jgi:hypothetical protein
MAFESGGQNMLPLLPGMLQLVVRSFLADSTAAVWLKLLTEVSNDALGRESPGAFAQAFEAVTPAVMSLLQADVLSHPEVRQGHFGEPSRA